SKGERPRSRHVALVLAWRCGLARCSTSLFPNALTGFEKSTMSLPLEGRTIALAEGRQLEDLARLLEKEGAATLLCPMVGILDAPDPVPVVAWLRALIADQYSHVVLLTGEGLRRLLGFAVRAGIRPEAIEAFGRVRTVTRGPKPGQALKEVGLAPSRVAVQP